MLAQKLQRSLEINGNRTFAFHNLWQLQSAAIAMLGNQRQANMRRETNLGREPQPMESE